MVTLKEGQGGLYVDDLLLLLPFVCVNPRLYGLVCSCLISGLGLS